MEDKEQFKQVLQLLLIVVPVFVALFIAYLFTPMHEQVEAGRPKAIITENCAEILKEWKGMQ